MTASLNKLQVNNTFITGQISVYGRKVKIKIIRPTMPDTLVIWSVFSEI